MDGRYYIPVNQPDLSGNEKKYLLQCIETGWISAEGPFVREFEEKFSRRIGRKFGVAVVNGSAALDIAVWALRLPRGSEIIMPSFTIISCASAILLAGLVPVLVDADPITWNMDTSKIEQKITSRTKAIMVVHIYGIPTKMDTVLSLAEKYGLRIIEDAAEMHGQTCDGKACGSFGDISIFSFYPNKHITTGEGGMVVTDNSDLAEYCLSLRNLCFKPGRRFVHDELGFNYRMTNLQAALGVAQLERLDEFVQRKRKIGKFYNEQLSGLTELELPPVNTTYSENIYWVYGIVLSDKVGFEADEMIRRLANLGVGTRPFFWGMHEQPVFRRMGLFSGEQYPVTERIARRGFYLPSGLALGLEQQVYVVKAVKRALFSKDI